MLLPALSKARAKARSITCVSNLKNMGVVFAIYEGDNNNWTPPSQDNAYFGGTQRTYLQMLVANEYIEVPKMGKQGVTACPEGGSIVKNFTWGSITFDVDSGKHMENSPFIYGMMAPYGEGAAWNFSGKPYLKCSKRGTVHKLYVSNESSGIAFDTSNSDSVTTPSDCTVLADSITDRNEEAPDAQWFQIRRDEDNLGEGGTSSRDKINRRHGGSASVLLGDGHAESLSKGGLLNYGWNSTSTWPIN